MGPVRN